MFSPQNINYDQVPYISWKGQTLKQITASIQKNKPTISKSNIFLPSPLKIYRKEIVTATVTNCNPRISTKIDDINTPGGYLVNLTTTRQNANSQGILNTLDINRTANTTERPGTCAGFTSNGMCNDQSKNALNRVRSAGMIRKKVKYNTNSVVPEPYCTTSQQYLATRGKLFNQNQYNFLRVGSTTAEPGTAGAASNQYAVNVGINYCPNASSGSFIPVYYKPNNSQFAQEGGVSSSARLARLKYDTITTNGAAFTRAYGTAVGNAMAYGTETDTYTVKDKMGYPNKSTPVFSKYKPGFTACSVPPLARPL
jgi:hypothetical protein